jgi:hypothetical protein
MTAQGSLEADVERLRAIDTIIGASAVYIRQPLNPLGLGSLLEDYGEVTIRPKSVAMSAELAGLLYPPCIAPPEARASSGV